MVIICEGTSGAEATRSSKGVEEQNAADTRPVRRRRRLLPRVAAQQPLPPHSASAAHPSSAPQALALALGAAPAVRRAGNTSQMLKYHVYIIITPRSLNTRRD